MQSHNGNRDDNSTIPLEVKEYTYKTLPSEMIATSDPMPPLQMISHPVAVESVESETTHGSSFPGLTNLEDTADVYETVPDVIQPSMVVDFVQNRLQGADFEEICEMGREAMDMRKISNIVIGQLAVEVEGRYGEDAIGSFSKEIGLNKQTVTQYRWVAKAFPGLTAYNGLSYTHYRLAAGTDKPQEWIDKAIENNWNGAQLKAKIDGKKLISESDQTNIQLILLEKDIDTGIILSKTILYP